MTFSAKRTINDDFKIYLDGEFVCKAKLHPMEDPELIQKIQDLISERFKEEPLMRTDPFSITSSQMLNFRIED